MKKQQEQRSAPTESHMAMAMTREETRDGSRKLHDLARLRIERNRAARHARCAIMRK